MFQSLRSPAWQTRSFFHASLLCIFLTTLLTAAGGPVAAATEKSSPVLDRVLQDSPEGSFTVWVYFAPRDLSPAERHQALQRARRNLHPDTALRRSRVRAAGQEIVDEKDLPLDAAHLTLAAATGARLRHPSRWLGAASFEATPAQIRALADLECVRRLDLVRTAMAHDPVPSPRTTFPDAGAERDWTLDYGPCLPTLEMINVPAVHELGYTGAGVNMAFLDSGFRLTHEAMDHIPVVAAYDIADDDPIVDWQPGDDEGVHDHGSQVLSAAMAFQPGQLIGAAFAASATLAKVDDGDILGLEDWWIAGLEWAEAQGADLVSSSYGYYTAYGYENLDGETAASTIAAEMAVARGLPVFNAAGNFGSSPEMNLIVAPADGDSVIAVGATDEHGEFASWASYGPTVDGRIKPDLAAQGQSVLVVHPDNPVAYTGVSGTSISTPLVAGTAALILERVPFLTPMQLREALIETASLSDEPNNLLGWGVINALEALHYWGPRFTHVPLPPTEDNIGPYVVETTLTDQFPLTGEGPFLLYRADEGPWQEMALTSLGNGAYRGEIPGQPAGTIIDYYLHAEDTQGLAAHWPYAGPDAPFSFLVHLDTEPPVLSHNPLGDVSLENWPPAIVVSATDNLGIDRVTLTCAVNGGPESEPVRLLRGAENLFAIPLPIPASELAAGDTVRYTITATDVARSMNTTLSGPHPTRVFDGPGEILLLFEDNGYQEYEEVAGWIEGAGYTVTSMNVSHANAEAFEGPQAVVFLANDSLTPLSFSSTCQNLENWVAGGGPLIIEGGEVGFAAAYDPGYPSFLANVLHVLSWHGDEAGDLVVAEGQSQHPILNHPQPIALPLLLDYSNAGDQDEMRPTSDAYVVLKNSESPGSSGVIVHDDSPQDSTGRVVFLPFALSALENRDAARNLVLNSLSHLLSTAMPSPVPDGPGTDTPRRTRLLGAVPNPFNARTLVRMEMAQAGPALVQLFDMRGRLVRTLHEGSEPLAVGTHEFLWDGQDDAGHNLGSGVYFARLTAGSVVSKAKIALVK